MNLVRSQKLLGRTRQRTLLHCLACLTLSSLIGGVSAQADGDTQVDPSGIIANWSTLREQAGAIRYSMSGKETTLRQSIAFDSETDGAPEIRFPNADVTHPFTRQILFDPDGPRIRSVESFFIANSSSGTFDFQHVESVSGGDHNITHRRPDDNARSGAAPLEYYLNGESLPMFYHLDRAVLFAHGYICMSPYKPVQLDRDTLQGQYGIQVGPAVTHQDGHRLRKVLLQEVFNDSFTGATASTTEIWCDPDDMHRVHRVVKSVGGVIREEVSITYSESVSQPTVVDSFWVNLFYVPAANGKLSGRLVAIVDEAEFNVQPNTQDFSMQIKHGALCIDIPNNHRFIYRRPTAWYWSWTFWLSLAAGALLVAGVSRRYLRRS